MIVYKKKGVIISERVDKLPRKNIYLRNILDLDYEFRLRYILLDLNWKSYGQRFIIRHWLDTFLAFELKIIGLRIWITIILFYWIWTLKYLDYGFGFWFLFILLDLDLKVLGHKFGSRLLDFNGFGLENIWTVI